MLLAELRPGTLASLQDTASSRTTVLMWGHNLVVQGQTTKADRSDVDLERKQHFKKIKFYFRDLLFWRAWLRSCLYFPLYFTCWYIPGQRRFVFLSYCNTCLYVSAAKNKISSGRKTSVWCLNLENLMNKSINFIVGREKNSNPLFKEKIK